MVSANTWYDLPWNIAATVKTGFTHDAAGANPEQITVTRAGTYIISRSFLVYRAGADVFLVSRILVDGTEVPGSFKEGYNNISSPYLWSDTMVVELDADDVVEIQVGTEEDGNDISFLDSGTTPDPTTASVASVSIARIGAGPQGPVGATGATGEVGALDDLSDVEITGTPANNEILAYNAGSSKWINQTDAEAGIGIAVCFFAYRTTAFVMAAIDTWYDYTWNIAAAIKRGFTHDNTSNPEQITITAAGVYEISWGLHHYNVASTVLARVLLDGTEVPGSYRQNTVPPLYCAHVSGTVLAVVTAGQVLELQVGTSLAGTAVQYGDDAGCPDPTTFVAAAISITRLGS